MKPLTHKPKFLFATNFSWWFGSLGQGRQPASAGLLNSSRSPAEAGSRNKVLGKLPPTEVGGKQDSCDVITTAKREIFASDGSQEPLR